MTAEGKPSTEPEIKRAIDGLVSIHARLILEIADAQRLKWPPPVNAWSDCGALIEAIVELERALAAATALRTLEAEAAQEDKGLAVAEEAERLIDAEFAKMSRNPSDWESATAFRNAVVAALLWRDGAAISEQRIHSIMQRTLEASETRATAAEAEVMQLRQENASYISTNFDLAKMITAAEAREKVLREALALLYENIGAASLTRNKFGQQIREQVRQALSPKEPS